MYEKHIIVFNCFIKEAMSNELCWCMHMLRRLLTDLGMLVKSSIPQHLDKTMRTWFSYCSPYIQVKTCGELTLTGHLTMAFTTGCRRISAAAPGEPPPFPSSLTLVSVVSLTYSHSSFSWCVGLSSSLLTVLSSRCHHCHWQSQPWPVANPSRTGLHWTYQTREKLLAVSQKGLLVAIPATKALLCKPNTKAKYFQENLRNGFGCTHS